MTTSDRAKRLENKQVFISYIVPAFNEALVIEAFLTALDAKAKELSQHYEIIVIDDASQDATFDKIIPLTETNPIKVLKFSRNFGKEIALSAGLEHCQGDVAILIDGDFQHPVETIPQFLDHWAKGYDMAYGIRKNREHESAIKRSFARFFYRLMTKITKVSIPPNAGDFRLLDRCIIDAINTIEERSRFMKGIYAWVGFKSIGVEFDVKKRAGGKSSWNFGSLAELAITGITSFSEIPLRFWGFIGLIISLISFLYAVYIICETLFFGVSTPGFATLIVAIMFLGGIQLLSIGILGEYIGRIFNEVKQRPLYILAKKIGFN